MVEATRRTRKGRAKSGADAFVRKKEAPDPRSTQEICRCRLPHSDPTAVRLGTAPALLAESTPQQQRREWGRLLRNRGGRHPGGQHGFGPRYAFLTTLR